MDRKYQIFVSSTYEDLKDERDEVIKACLTMKHVPVGMEMFNAADEEQWAVIKRTIDQCDYYVVIVAQRYGSLAPDGLSYTEKEYDYAVVQGVPVLGFILSDGASWPTKYVDRENLQLLDAFKRKIKTKMVRFWSNRFELQAQIAMSLSAIFATRPRRGWVRAPEHDSIDMARKISQLYEENARLRDLVHLEAGFDGDAAGDVGDILMLLDKSNVVVDRKIKIYGRKVYFEILQYLEEGRTKDWLLDTMALRGLGPEKAADLLDDLRFYGAFKCDGELWKLTTFGRRVAAKIAASSNWQRR